VTSCVQLNYMLMHLDVEMFGLWCFCGLDYKCLCNEQFRSTPPQGAIASEFDHPASSLPSRLPSARRSRNQQSYHTLTTQNLLPTRPPHRPERTRRLSLPRSQSRRLRSRQPQCARHTRQAKGCRRRSHRHHGRGHAFPLGSFSAV
jgi:hypothetical protein